MLEKGVRPRHSTGTALDYKQYKKLQADEHSKSEIKHKYTILPIPETPIYSERFWTADAMPSSGWDCSFYDKALRLWEKCDF